MSEEKIVMYSTSWCPDCIRAKLVFKKLKAAYTNIDVDHNQEGLAKVKAHNGGIRVVPTIFFPDGSVLIEPSNQELTEKVVALGLSGK